MVHPAAVEPTDDPARAARRIMTDDGFNVGVLYKGRRKPFAGQVAAEAGDAAVFDEEFAL